VAAILLPSHLVTGDHLSRSKSTSFKEDGILLPSHLVMEDSLSRSRSTSFKKDGMSGMSFKTNAATATVTSTVTNIRPVAVFPLGSSTSSLGSSSLGSSSLGSSSLGSSSLGSSSSFTMRGSTAKTGKASLRNTHSSCLKELYGISAHLPKVTVLTFSWPESSDMEIVSLSSVSSPRFFAGGLQNPPPRNVSPICLNAFKRGGPSSGVVTVAKPSSFSEASSSR